MERLGHKGQVPNIFLMTSYKGKCIHFHFFWSEIKIEISTRWVEVDGPRNCGIHKMCKMHLNAAQMQGCGRIMQKVGG